MPSLRELLGEWLHEKARSLGEYRLLEGLIEAVEPEDIPSDEEYNEARDAIIRKLRKERDSAELKLKALEPIDERIRADAEIGRLVRGMELSTGLQRTYASLDGVPHGVIGRGNIPSWVSFRSFLGDCQYISVSKDDPAEALRSIQEVGDAEV